MAGDRLSLGALMSFAVVAYTIEFDNEAEARMQHRTSLHGSTSAGSPWLVSMAMWMNCMRFVGEDPITIETLYRRARTRTNLRGMIRWGYIRIGPATSPSGKKLDPKDRTLTATPAGLASRETWQTLGSEIEQRWRERFGDALNELRGSLNELVNQFDFELPDCLPIITYGLKTNVRQVQRRPGEGAGSPENSLASLLAKAVLAYTLRFERQSELSLPICANVLRPIENDVIRIADLPARAGVSKEAIAMMTGFLARHGYAEIRPETPETRLRILCLTPNGLEAKDSYARIGTQIEEEWHSCFGGCVERLRAVLEEIAGNGLAGSPLFEGLNPYPTNWRASVKPPKTLPHQPMVLHRGGYPDGS